MRGRAVVPCFQWILVLWAVLCITAREVPAFSETRPFTDATIEPRSPPLRPELILGREGYDQTSRRHALYLRLFEPSVLGTVQLKKVASGSLWVRGATIVEVLWRKADLQATEPHGSAPILFGLEGASYDGPERGLEGDDPFVADPRVDPESDALRLSPAADRLDFHLATTLGVDDLRVVIEYPDPPHAASFMVRLYHVNDCEGQCGPQEWPPGNVRGMVLGRIEPSAVPDDGVYAGVIELPEVALLVQDLDLSPTAHDFGTVVAGTRSQALTLWVDNGAHGIDLDQDNGVDLNGPFGRLPTTPYPVNVDLTAVRARARDLVGPGGSASEVRVEVAGEPLAVAVGERRPLEIRVDVPPAQPPGSYAGILEVFEDENGNGLPDDRTVATLSLQWTVVAPVDAGLEDGGMDAGLAEDGGLPDGGPGDGGSPDGGLEDGGPVDAGVPDAGSLDAGSTESDGGVLGRLRGGACSCSASGKGSAGLLLMALLLLWTLRGRFRPRILGSAIVAVLAMSPSRVSAQGFDLLLFRPTTPEGGYLGTESAYLLPRFQVSAGMVLGYARDPLLRYDQGRKQADVLRDLFTAEVGVSLGLGGPLQLGVSFPLVLPRGRSLGGGELASAALGDLRFLPKLGLFSGDRFSLALVTEVVFPTGDEQSFAGERGFAFAPRLVLEAHCETLRVALNLGYRFREALRLEGSLLDDEVFYRAAILVRVHPALEVVGEVAGATSAVLPFRRELENPLEALIGLRFLLENGVSLLAGAGAGILPGYGSPTARAFLGVGFAPRRPVKPPRPADRDGDGVPDDVDKCPDRPGPAVWSGCPDSDGDGIPDHLDKCPQEPQGPHGVDGCPGPPPPPPDRDGDGVPDDVDQCPDRPGPAVWSGCPDSDGDGIPDHLDHCPFEKEDPDGFQDQDGCPDPDNDFDGIPDERDPQPLEPRPPVTLRRIEPPPELRQSIRYERRELRIVERIGFVTGTSRIAKESQPALDRVAALVRAMDILKLRVDGHVETLAGVARRKLVELSERLAEEVRQALIQRGVEADRLAILGWGDRRPLVKPGQKTANRRVEFVVVEE
jgi:OOP family OmpA-OmpF porin